MTNMEFNDTIKALQAVFAERFLDRNKRTVLTFAEVIRKNDITDPELRDELMRAYLAYSTRHNYLPDETDSMANIMAHAIRGFKAVQDTRTN